MLILTKSVQITFHSSLFSLFPVFIPAFCLLYLPTYLPTYIHTYISIPCKCLIVLISLRDATVFKFKIKGMETCNSCVLRTGKLVTNVDGMENQSLQSSSVFERIFFLYFFVYSTLTTLFKCGKFNSNNLKHLQRYFKL